MATKRIPYGISDFQLLASDDYYYVDKTRFIEEIEKAPSFLFLIRPRRFGKSLFLSMLELYYDVNTRDQFDALFGKYYIGQYPTEKRNSYLILKFNFSQVNPEPDALMDSFEEHTSMLICWGKIIWKDMRKRRMQAAGWNTLPYVANRGICRCT